MHVGKPRRTFLERTRLQTVKMSAPLGVIVGVLTGGSLGRLESYPYLARRRGVTAGPGGEDYQANLVSNDLMPPTLS